MARKVIDGVTVRGALVQIGSEKIDAPNGTGLRSTTNRSSARSAGGAALRGLSRPHPQGWFVGWAVIELVAEGLPAGWGAPIYGKLDQDITSALMSINAVKGVEIGEGFSVAELTGEENADEMRMGPNGEIIFGSNRAGGILVASRRAAVIARFAVKPTSSILTTGARCRRRASTSTS